MKFSAFLYYSGVTLLVFIAIALQGGELVHKDKGWEKIPAKTMEQTKKSYDNILQGTRTTLKSSRLKKLEQIGAILIADVVESVTQIIKNDFGADSTRYKQAIEWNKGRMESLKALATGSIPDDVKDALNYIRRTGAGQKYFAAVKDLQFFGKPDYAVQSSLDEFLRKFEQIYEPILNAATAINESTVLPNILFTKSEIRAIVDEDSRKILPVQFPMDLAKRKTKKK